ncbi:hypothetical protein GGG16DRAFT_103217 [Schizophyllum commune]
MTVIEHAASVANVAMLRANDLPNDLKIQAINEQISLLESGFGSIPLCDTPTREKILAQLNIQWAILAPIRRLPVEILSDVFSRVVKAFPLRTLQVSSTLASVCVTWRKVTRGHAALWTRLIVKTLRDFDRYEQYFLPLTKHLPLDLRCEERKILSDLWERIVPYASRWRSVILEGRLSMLPDLKVLCMERLERLVVDAYDAPTSAELSALDFVVAPDLRHLKFTIDVLQSERQLHIPVTRTLTSLEITAESPFLVALTLPLLTACANTLQSLILKIRQTSDGADGSYPASAASTFEMQALIYLSLVDSTCALLDHITTPVIHELVLGNVPAYGSRLLLNFLKRSPSSLPLEVLRVYDVEERDPSAWIPCLEVMNNVRALHFDDLLSNKEFLEKMISHEGKPLLLPALEGIAIWRVFWSHLELHDIITEMCCSREKETVKDEEWLLLGWLDEHQ